MRAFPISEELLLGSMACDTFEGKAQLVIVNAGPNLNSSRRSNSEHSQRLASPSSTSLPLPFSR